MIKKWPISFSNVSQVKIDKCFIRKFEWDKAISFVDVDYVDLSSITINRIRMKKKIKIIRF